MSEEESREEPEKRLKGVKGITIPVNHSFEGRHRVLDFSELERVLRSAEVISQGECHCRKDKGDDRCKDPMDGCFGLDDFAREAIEKYGERQITVEEALEAMERTHDAGFVHLYYSFGGGEKPEIVCSCCSCCCGLLGVAAEMGFSPHIFESRYVANHDSDRCRSCGTCAERCQFGARQIHDGILVFDRDKCFGCGVCVRTCPEGAIGFVGR